MKILQVVSYFPPAYAFGGPVNVAYQISKKLTMRGNEVVVYTSDAKNIHSRLNLPRLKLVDGMFINYFKNISMSTVSNYNLFITPDIIFHIKNEIKDFNIIHLHEYRTFQNIIAYKYAKKYKIPYVLQAHGSICRNSEKNNLKKLFDLSFGYDLLAQSSGVIAISEQEKQQYIKFGVEKDKITIIPNGVDLSLYNNLSKKCYFKRRYDIEKNVHIILYLGRINKNKGIDFLIKAYSELVEKHKNIKTKLVIAGPDDGYLDELKKLIYKLNISDKVIFTGFLTESEKMLLYIDSSVVAYVEPSNVFGLVPLEAAASCKPVIVSNKNAISKNIIEGRFGYSVKYGDIEELNDNIFNLINDKNLRNELGNNGRKYVFNNYNWDNIILKIEKLYQMIVLNNKNKN